MAADSSGTESSAGPAQPNNLIAALAYVLGLVTGIVFLYLEPYDRDEYVRFHAHQSIAYSVAWFVINVVAGVFVAVLPRSLGAVVAGLQELINIALAVGWVYLMYQAYIGNKFRVPVISEWLKNVGV